MKLEKRFSSSNNKLYFLDGKEVSIAKDNVLNATDCVDAANVPDNVFDIYMINTQWSLVGTDESSYNEEFLASFRDYLKALEEKGGWAVIVPVADKTVSEADKEQFVQSFKHCARRIKDCISVAGFAVPAEADSSYFMEELSAKHAHYVFFSSDKALLSNPEIVAI